MINRRHFHKIVLSGAYAYLGMSREGQSNTSKRYTGLYLVGDSHVNGLSPFMSNLLLNSIRFKSKGINGTSIQSWGPLAHKLDKAESPTLLLLCLGTNDATMDYPESEKSEALRLLDVLRKVKGYDVIWITPPFIDSKLPKAKLIREMVHSMNVMNIDCSKFIVEMQPDGIHLTNTGYGQWAKGIIDILRRMKVVI